MQRVFPCCLLLLLLLLTPTVSQAQIPRTISFQGVLADAGGVLVPDGPQDLTITIYDAATGGNTLFSETIRATVIRGVFNAIIGSSDPAGIPAAIAFDNQYWLGVKIGTAAELAPRTAFTSVPYALNAAIAQRAIVADRADTATWANAASTSDTTANIRGGHVVSVNGQQGTIEILGGGATTVTRNGNQIQIRSTDTSGGGIRRIDNFDGSLVADPPQGPFVTLFIREGGVQTHHYRNLSITSEKLAIGAIGTDQLADFAVTNPKLAPNSVTSDKIVDGTIITEDLADNSVTSPKIVDGQVLTQDIGDLQVTNVKLGPDAVTTDKIMDGQVQTADIADENVTNAKIGPDAVTTDKIMDGQVQTADIADENVTNAKLGPDAVTTDKIMDGQVQTADIADGNVTNAKLGADAVTTDKIMDGQVQNADLADGSVNSAKILDGTIATIDIADNAVLAAKIGTGGAPAGTALMSDGSATPVWGNPVASDLILPFAKTQAEAVPLFSLTNTGTGGVGVFTVDNATSTANALTATTNGLGTTAIVTQTNVLNGVPALDVRNDATGGGAHGIRSFAKSGASNAVFGTTEAGVGVRGSSTLLGGSGFHVGVMGTVGSGTIWYTPHSGMSGFSSRGPGVVAISDSNIALAALQIGPQGSAIYGRTGPVGGANSSTTMRLENASTGMGMELTMQNSASTADALRVSVAGTGRAGFFDSPNAASVVPALDVRTGGLDYAIDASSSAPSGGGAIRASTSFTGGSGGSIVALANGTGGYAGYFQTVNGANGLPTVAVYNAGLANSLSLQSVSVTNASPTLHASHSGIGSVARLEALNATNPSSAMAVSTNGLGSVARFDQTNSSTGSSALVVQSSTLGSAISASSPNSVGSPTISATSAQTVAVFGFTNATVGGTRYGVGGMNTFTGAWAALGDYDHGIYASAGTGTWAGYFVGNVHVAGTLSKSAGSFRIDHPLDPENRILSHSFVESPDMMNIYNGTVILDANGEATVEMPEWFEALNRDFRYQLTCIGGYAPVYVAGKMNGNRFRIAGGAEGLEVSWQVTGVRHDPYAEQHRIPVEEDKRAEDRGTYLNPDVYTVGGVSGSTSRASGPRSQPTTPTATSEPAPTQTGPAPELAAPDIAPATIATTPSAPTVPVRLERAPGADAVDK